jgi:hypothetical protein
MKRRIAASLTIALWALFTYIGYYLLNASVQRDVPGFPNAAQRHYYLHFPLVMLAISVGLLLFAKKIPTPVFVAAWSLQLFAFIPFFLGYTGGM